MNPFMAGTSSVEMSQLGIVLLASMAFSVMSFVT